jgi:uncharacterized protein (TIGR00255 family)
MLKSMTAFGRAESSLEGRTYTVEIRTLNRRYLEVAVRAPREFLPLEERLKKRVGKALSRGRVEVTVIVRHTSDAVYDIEVNFPLARAYYKTLCELGEDLGIEQEVSLRNLLAMEGIISVSEPEVDLEQTWASLAPCVDEALSVIDGMRISEGEALGREFEKRLLNVEKGLSDIREMAPSVLSEHQSRLEERLSLLTEGKVELDPARLAQEAAFLADKSDITEEIVRAESHLKQFRHIMGSDGPKGRALDFLLQELNREVNTMGSKAGDADLSHVVVNLKSELEKIREQVQNLE